MALHDVETSTKPSYPRRRRTVPPSSSRGLDRRAPGLLAILWRRKLVILASILVALALGVAYIAVTPPRYTATAAMLIDPRLGKSVGSDPNTPGFIADTAAIDSQIKLFTSQTVLSRVAKEAKLAADPEFNGSQRGLLQKLLHPGTAIEGGVDLKTLEDAITIKRPERTYVVEIDALARDPKKAAEIANDVTQAYIKDQVSARVGAAREDTQYVRQNLDKLSAQIREVDDKIEAYKAKNRIVETSGLRSNEQQVADLTKSLGEARAKESDLKSRLAEIETMAKLRRLDGVGDALKSTTIERLRQQQSETEQNAARLGKTLGDRHPEMIEARERQIKIRALISDELNRIRSGLRSDYQAARANEKQIVAEVDRLKGESANMNKALVPLEQMQRNRAVLRSSFDRFAQVNDTLAQQTADSPPGRVIAVAQPPVSPSKPKKSVVALVALSSGVFVGLAAALFAESASTPAQEPVRGPARPVPAEPTTEPEREPARMQRPRRRYWDDDEDEHPHA